MADPNDKQPENVPGPWYVDVTCTPCRVCIEEAPNLLRLNQDETYMYFFKQPENAQEMADAQRAMDVCPTLAIGNDGEESDPPPFKTPADQADTILSGSNDPRNELSPTLAEPSSALADSVHDRLSSPYIYKGHAANERNDPVTFAAFAPCVFPGQQFVLDIWAHTRVQSSEVAKLAAEVRRSQKLGIKSGISVARGSVLALAVEIREMHVPDPTDVLVWEGVPTNSSFLVEVPGDTKEGDYPGKATITAAGLPIAKLIFSVPVIEKATEKHATRLASTLSEPQTAFASYASEDRNEVLARVQGMKKIRPDLDVFLDVVSLRSGEHWEQRLRTEIPARDVFFLFWSLHSSRSTWVEWEWRCALETRGLERISPVPLVDPRNAVPPKELSALHFDDFYAAFARAESLSSP